MKTREELNAIREAQKRTSWIENVKRVKDYSQEEAEAAWTKIFAPEQPQADKHVYETSKRNKVLDEVTFEIDKLISELVLHEGDYVSVRIAQLTELKPIIESLKITQL